MVKTLDKHYTEPYLWITQSYVTLSNHQFCWWKNELFLTQPSCLLSETQTREWYPSHRKHELPLITIHNFIFQFIYRSWHSAVHWREGEVFKNSIIKGHDYFNTRFRVVWWGLLCSCTFSTQVRTCIQAILQNFSKDIKQNKAIRRWKKC